METAVPREKLKELMEKNGDGLLQDRDRCEGLLKDYCGGHRREISAIVGALEERVPLELKSSWQTAMTPEAMRARLVQRLEDNRGLAPEIANYAVDTWSYALGVGLGRSSDRIADVVPIPTQNGFAATPSAEERAAADRPAGSVPGAAAVQPAIAKAGATGGLSNQNKAIVGGVGLLAAAAVAFALLHHPTPAAPPNNNPPAQNGQNGQNQAPPAVQKGLGSSSNGAGANQGNGATSQQTNSSSIMASGTPVVVRLDSDFNSDNATVGEMLPATVVSPLTSEGNVVVQRGASAQIKVVQIDKSGKLSGKSRVQFALVGLTAHGKLVHVSGSSKEVDGPSQGAKTAERTGIGAAAGAAVGAIAGHLFHHAGTGAAVGAGAGGATGALTSHPAPVKVNAETVLQFRLTKGIPMGS
jgi:YMGG-like Gly-zipper